jgi:hypothetical protein
VTFTDAELRCDWDSPSEKMLAKALLREREISARLRREVRAILPYTRHAPGCGHVTPHGACCTCGLERALRGAVAGDKGASNG